MHRLIEAELENISGVDTSGGARTLDEFLKPGRYTLVWWHPQALSPASCRSCSGASAEPLNLLQAIHEGGCDVLGLTYESPERVNQYLRGIGLIYPVLSVTENEAEAHGVAKSEGEPWPSIPHRVAYLVDEHGQIINTYEVNDPVSFLRLVRDDVSNGPPESKWVAPVRKRGLFAKVFG